MVKIHPPYKPDVEPTEPETRVSVMPSPHIRFTEDVGYYDAMGRDPLQMFQVWGIKEPEEKMKRLKEVLPEFEGVRYHRHLLQDAALRGDEVVVRFMVGTGLKVHPDIPGQNGIPPKRRGRDEDEEMEDDDADADAEEESDDAQEDDGDENWEDEDDQDEEMQDDDDDDPNKDDPTVAPFHVAAGRGHLECVRIMLEDGKVPIDIRDEAGRTALIAATQGSHHETVIYLLEQGANPTLRLDPNSEIAQEYFNKLAGADALEFAAGFGKLETVKLLLEHPIYGSRRRRAWKEGAEPGVYVTPLAICSAAGSHSFETLEYLLDRAGWPMTAKDGQTKSEQLNDAQKQTIDEMTDCLIEDGDHKSIQMVLSYIHPTDASGTVLPFDVPKRLHKVFIWGAYEAIIRGDIPKFSWIFSFGLKEHDSMSLDTLPSDQLLNIQHLFDKAAATGQIDCLKFLIENHNAKPDINRLPPATRPIYTAAANDKPDVVSYLLDNFPIDIHHGNGIYATGPTALHVSILLKSYASILALLKAGGPVDHIDPAILTLTTPLSAILTADMKPRAPIRLLTEQNAQSYISKHRANWQSFNPPYVRLDLTPEDKAWLDKLVPRKSDEELKEVGSEARKLNKDDEREDPCEYLVEWPIERKRQDELEGDDDVMPAWKALYVLAG